MTDAMTFYVEVEWCGTASTNKMCVQGRSVKETAP